MPVNWARESCDRRNDPVSGARIIQLTSAAAIIEALPEGYDTEIGKRGVKLSEAQRQRISIARPLLKDQQILLLDEADQTPFVDGCSIVGRGAHAELMAQKGQYGRFYSVQFGSLEVGQGEPS